MSNLYELSESLARINDELVATGGELTIDLEKLLDECSLAFKEKAESIGKWRLNLNGEIAALDSEIVRLVNRKVARENLNNRLKEYVKVSMEKAGIEKLTFGSFTFRLQANPPSVEVWNEKEVPAKFITIIPESKSIDKKGILAALKKGEEVPGSTLITGKTHLRQE